MLYSNLVLPGFAGAELFSRDSQYVLNPRFERVRASEHTLRDPFRLFERRQGLAEIVERGAVVPVERRRVSPPHSERDAIALS